MRILSKLLAFSLLFVSTTCFAGNRVTLQDGSGNEYGTTANPLKATVTGAVGDGSGAGSFTDLTTTGNNTLGNAVTDTITLTGKIVGASPQSFDGSTVDAIYTIFAFTDPLTSSKTVTFPAVTGKVMYGSAATALTAGAAVTLTIGVGGGNQFYTDTIVTDNQDQTITFSAGGAVGDRITIMLVTDTGGSGDEVITFETTLTNTAGTLTLANLTAGRYLVSFLSDGTVWNEVARTAALS